MHNVINIKSNVISHLNNIYNKNFIFSTNYKHEYSGFNLIVKESEEIEIETDIKSKKDLDNFIIEIRKTNVKNFFDKVTLKVKFNQFLNCPNSVYVTNCLSTNKKKEFFVKINVNKL